MKKLISLILALVMVLGLCACGGEAGQEGGKDAASTDGLQVGYAKINITPEYPVGMGGFSDQEKRIHTGLVGYIYATCIAVTSGEETILLYTIDIGGMNEDRQKMFRPSITQATGIAEDKIFMGSTHTHNAPATSGYPNAERYVSDLTKWLVQVGTEAMADRSPATFYQTKANHEGMNFVRHYIMEDGTMVANSDVSDPKKIVGHPMESDTLMTLLKFERADETKKDIIMVNWQTHPADTDGLGYYNIGPDFVGPLRDKLEKDTGAHVAYFSGAVGNQVPDSKWKEEAHGLEWNEYGEKLAELALPMLDNLQPVEGTQIKILHYTFQAEVDHSWDHMLAEANEVWNIYKSTDRKTGDAAGEKYGFSSSYQARAIRTRAEMGTHIPMEMNVFCIGSVGFTTGTYEMFSDNGIYVKTNSPFDATFMICGTSTYMPSDVTYTYRGYEQDTTYYARGTGEAFAEKYVELLNQIK